MGNITIKSKKSDEATVPLLVDQENQGVEKPAKANRTTEETIDLIEEEEKRTHELFLEDLKSRQQHTKTDLAQHDIAKLRQEGDLFKRIQPPVEKKSGWFSCFSCFFGKKEASEEEQPLNNSKHRIN